MAPSGHTARRAGCKPSPVDLGAPVAARRHPAACQPAFDTELTVLERHLVLLPTANEVPQAAARAPAGLSKGQQVVNFGDYGLKALEAGWVTNRQIEAARIAMTRKIRRGGKVWINVFPDKPVSQKPAETRMGSGKGAPEHWVAVVKPGRDHVRAVRRSRAARPRGNAARQHEAADHDEVREAGGRAVKMQELRTCPTRALEATRRAA